MPEQNSDHNRLIIVSNRLPVAIRRQGDELYVEPGSGGLVTAMAPVLKNRGGVWIGWPGIADVRIDEQMQVLKQQTEISGYRLHPVALTKDEKEKFYEGFANEVLWPLFHDFTAFCVFKPEYWSLYRKVNRKFADEIKPNLREKDFVWVHDYHLMTVAEELRALGVTGRVAFYLHIPFPPLDIFLMLPWRFQILEALLEYDLIGFQTERYRRNFVQCVRALIPKWRSVGRGQVMSLRQGERDIRLGVFPISIDYKDFERDASSESVSERAWLLHEEYPEQKIILGVDRLDYTKGIPERLQGFRIALERFPELHEKVSLVQVVVPSRRSIPRYADMKLEIEHLVSEINGEFTRPGWVPIHYMFRSLQRDELLAHYRTAEIALVTPIKDGMNLVAKEYCACNIEENGVLILSEFAGTAAAFHKHAVLVNPHDVVGLAHAIKRAVDMSEAERRPRMKQMRRIVRKNHIFRWVDSFLQAAFARDLDDFPITEDFMPPRLVTTSEPTHHLSDDENRS